MTARRAPKVWAYLAEGNCLEVMRAIPEHSVQMVLCDLPYGITACRWDKKVPLEPLWKEYQRLTPENGVIALFAQQPFAMELAAAAPKNLFRYEWVWDKGCTTGYANARRMPLRRHENVLIFYRKLPTYNPQGLKACARRCRKRGEGSEVYRSGMADGHTQTFTGYPQSIIAFKRDRGSAACQKPVALLDYLVRTYTNSGETVLDNTMGTGSTGEAAIEAGRNFIGIELDPERFRAAEHRITQTMRRHGACRARSWFSKADA